MKSSGNTAEDPISKHAILVRRRMRCNMNRVAWICERCRLLKRRASDPKGQSDRTMLSCGFVCSCQCIRSVRLRFALVLVLRTVQVIVCTVQNSCASQTLIYHGCGAGVTVRTPLSWNPWRVEIRAGWWVLRRGLNASKLESELVDPSRLKGTSFPTPLNGDARRSHESDVTPVHVSAGQLDQAERGPASSAGAKPSTSCE